MTDEQKTRFTFPQDLAAISVEDALARKEAISKEKRESETTLETLLAEQRRTVRETYLNTESPVASLWLSIKEFFGYGRSYAFRQNLQQLGTAVSQAERVAKNAHGLCIEYAGTMTQVREESMQGRELFALNIILYDNKQAQLAEKKEKLAVMHKQSVLGTAGTSEAMALEREVLTVENDLAQLDVENDTLAVTLSVAKHKLDANKALYQHLRSLAGILSEQHAVAHGHYQLGQAQLKLMDGTKGVESARLVYERAGVAVAKFREFQKQAPDIASVSFDERFHAPSLAIVGASESWSRYWRTVAPTILGEAYHGTSGNGKR